MSAWGQPPRPFAWMCVFVVLVATGMTFAGAVSIGVTVDETFHVVRLRNYFDAGWYLLDDDLGQGGPGDWVGDSFVYAPVATLFLHVINVVVGQESWGHVSAAQDAYVVRHLGVAALGVCTTAATAAMTRLVSGSWRWGVVTAAVLVALPMWSGHSMFNVKDIPVATGYTFVTVACMLVGVLHRESRARRLFTGVLLLAGVVLAIGTRPAIWPGLAAAVLCVVLFVVVRRGSGRSEWWRVGDAALAVLGGLTSLVVIYPSVFAHPVQWALGAPAESAGYQGQRFWGYIPLTIMSTVPLVLLFFGLVGSAVRFRGWLPHLLSGVRIRDVLVVLVVLQALLLPCIMIVRMPSLNGGLRHLLFAAPAVAVLMVAGIAQVLGDAPGRRSRIAVTCLAAVGIVTPTVAQAQLFPLSYSYANALSDSAHLGLPADFWQASFREYGPMVGENDFVVCGAKLDDKNRPLRQMPNGGQSWLDVSQDCASADTVSVLQPFVEPGRQTLRGRPVEPDFIALLVFDDAAPEGCTEIGRVTRRRFVTEVVASRAWRCPLVLPDYPGSITFNGAGSGAVFLLGGWTGVGGDDWITVHDRASLGFSVERDSSIRVRVSGSTDGDLKFLLNNEPVLAEEVSAGWVLSPNDLPDVGAPDNVVLTVIAETGEARISGVEIVREDP
jgi:hypothetical protein